MPKYRQSHLNSVWSRSARTLWSAVLVVLGGCFDGEMQWTRIDGTTLTPVTTPSGLPVLLPGTPPAVTGVADQLVAARAVRWAWGCSALACTYRYVIDMDPAGAPSGTYSAVTQASQESGTGIYYLHVQAKDETGVESAVVHVSGVLDNTSPAIPSGLTLIVPAASPGSDSSPVIRVNDVSAGDRIELHGDANCSSLQAAALSAGSDVTLQPQNLSDGTYTFFARALDALGNASACTPTGLVYVLDTTPFSVTGLADDGNLHQAKTWTWGCDKGSCSYRYVIDQSSSTSPTGDYGSVTTATQSSGNGTYYIHVQAIDNSNGRESSVVHALTYLDNMPPGRPGPLSLGAGLTSPGNNSRPTIHVEGVSAGDTVGIYTGSNCELVTMKDEALAATSTIDIELSTALADGSYEFYAKTTDAAGNSSLCSNSSVSYTLDSVAPTVTGLATDSVATKSKIWSWGCSEAVCTYRFVVDTSSDTTPGSAYGATATASQTTGTGTYYVHVQARDEAGNESAVVHVSAVIDNTAPSAPSSLTLVSPLGSPGNDNTPTIRIAGVSSGDTAKLYTDSSCQTQYLGYATSAGTYADVTPASAMTDGTYTFYSRSHDPAGNWSSCSVASVEYVLDTAVVSVTGLANDDTVKQSKTWTWGCNKASCTYVFAIDQNEFTTPSGDFVSDASATQSSGNGTYYLHVQAEDAAGNISGVWTVSAILDNLAPAAPGPLALVDPLSSPSSDPSATIRVSNVTSGDTVHLHLNAACDDQSLGSATVATGLSDVDVTTADLEVGSHPIYAQAVDPVGNKSPCSSTYVSYNFTGFVCPLNYVRVTGNADFATKSFCISKYEMKALDAGGTLIPNGAVAYQEQYIAAARPEGTPWVTINRDMARAECKALGSEYDLVTNAQWQTIARDIEKQDGNWLGTRGTGVIYRGHSDTSPGNTLAASPLDSDSYVGTDNLTNEQRRTHVLSTGATIWDFAGNAAEWVLEDYAFAFGGSQYVYELSPDAAGIARVGGLNGNAKFHFGPAADYRSTLANAAAVGGLGYAGIGMDGQLRGILRGGAYMNGLGTGVFASDLSVTWSYLSTSVGFRCAWNGTLGPSAPTALELTYPATVLSADPSPVIRVHGVSAGDMVSLYSNPSCAGGWSAWANSEGPTVDISLDLSGLAYATYTYYARRTSGGIDSPCSSVSVSYAFGGNDAQNCPQHFVLVEGNSGYGTSTFCVSKFPMKAKESLGTELLYGGDGAGEWVIENCMGEFGLEDCSHYVPIDPVLAEAVSRPDGTPWTHIPRDVAKAECESLGYHLITNAEWQTVARAIELFAPNWSGGVVGSGMLNRGHSDYGIDPRAASSGVAFESNGISLALASAGGSVSFSDAQGYLGTGNSSLALPARGWEQKRTHTLPNGEVIWDFSGNVLQWVADGIDLPTDFGDDYYISTLIGGLTHTTSGTIGATTGNAAYHFGAKYAPYRGTVEYGGLGYLYTPVAATTIVRGGSWLSGTLAGIFGTDLDHAAETLYYDVGFRCVASPF